MKHKEFHDLDHIIQYLCGSVIRYKGVPVYAKTAQGSRNSGGYSVYLEQLDVVDQGKWIKLDDPDIDMNPVPLGFVNYYEYNQLGCAIKATRFPNRAWKIGVSTANLSLSNIIPEYGTPRASSLMFTRFFKSTILGEYSTLTIVNALVKGSDPCAQAFSRHFAVDNKGQLWHLFCAKPVGTVGKDDQVNLHDPYKFLAETLQKDVAR